jgi:hypothetical protein
MRPSVPDAAVDHEQIGRPSSSLDSGTLPPQLAAVRRQRPDRLRLHHQHRVRLSDNRRRTQLGLVTPQFITRMQIEGDQFVASVEKHPARGGGQRASDDRASRMPPQLLPVCGAEGEHCRLGMLRADQQHAVQDDQLRRTFGLHVGPQHLAGPPVDALNGAPNPSVT